MRDSKDHENVPEQVPEAETPEPDEEESDEAYRLRVYGEDSLVEPPSIRRQSFRRASQRLSSELMRRRSSVLESLPETPQGWAVLGAAVASLLVGYEVQLQKHLTSAPVVYGQCKDKDSALYAIYRRLTEGPDSILTREIQPSLLIGTRGLLSSTAAYLLRGPQRNGHVGFREVMTMTGDGAKIAMDWELPLHSNVDQDQVLKGPIRQPVVLVLHGINNTADFGYVRNLVRACTNQGWIAAGVNFRGCTLPLATPRGYNGAYTGDLRCILQRLEPRMAEGASVFLIGNSLSANLVTKYLGEEGLAGTLPKCVAGAVALGNPLTLASHRIDPLTSPLMAMGVKKMILENLSTYRHMTDSYFRSALRKALLAVTLADFDRALSPVFIRNDPYYPFGVTVGYKSGEEYWREGSSYRYAPHISVPTLQVVAGDDFLIYSPFRGRLQFCMSNPNIMVVETKCGGHLGWQEVPPDDKFSVGKSWADTAGIEFIAAVLEQRSKSDQSATIPEELRTAYKQDAVEGAKSLRSRL